MKSEQSNKRIELGLPCKNSIQHMTRDEKGYHCASCEKHLIDFRENSLSEIHAIIQTSTKKICGVFRSSQVDYKVSTVTFSKANYRVGLSLLGILGFLGPVLQSCEAPSEDVTVKKQHAFNNLKFPMHLKGTLVDEKTKAPLANAPLKILQNGKVILTGFTNADGDFDILIAEKDLKHEAFDLAYTAKGHLSDTLKKQNLLQVKTHEKIRLTLQASPESCGVPTGKTINDTSIPVPGEIIVEGGIAPPIPEEPPTPDVQGEPAIN